MNWYIIFFFFLAVVLYLYTRYIRLQRQSQQEKIEAFETDANKSAAEKLLANHNLKLKFLSAQLAASQMQSHAKEYISKMNQPNLVARGVETQSELLAAYSNAFLDITAEEGQRINEFVLELLSQVQYKYPAYYRYLCKYLARSSFAKAQNSLEGGMPHTLGNMIVMDSNWFAAPRATTLIHELTHIHQRTVPFEFEDLYTQWGYIQTVLQNIKGLEPVLLLNRNNPDGMSPNWLWRDNESTYWWIGATFSSAIPSSLGDVNLIAIKITRDAEGNFYYLKQNPTPLNTLKSFIQYFGGANPNNYHPNEMSAKFAEWYLEDTLGTPNHRRSKSNGTSTSTPARDNISDEYHDGYRIYKDYINKLLETY